MYIIDSLCISPQQTYQANVFPIACTSLYGNKYHAQEPSYKELIPAGLLRRMSKITRMGVGTGLPLLENHSNIKAILMGTAYGGINDAMTFLNQIEDFNEGTLTPTHFVQSTPNATASVLAMMTQNNAYNNTHVHEALAFENTLLEAKLLLDTDTEKILVGGLDEISEWNFNINKRKSLYKIESADNNSLLNSSSAGTVCGEGAALFVLEKSPNIAQTQILDVCTVNTEKKSEIVDFVQLMLSKNKLMPQNMDALVLGINGDKRYDDLYTNLHTSLFENAGIFTYKNLCGDYPTASSFGLWIANQIICNSVPFAEVIYKPTDTAIKYMLLYNHYLGKQHGFILIASH